MSHTHQLFTLVFLSLLLCAHRGLICLRFPDCCRASLIYMLCSPRCPDFCHVSRLYCPFSVCFYCKLTYIYLYSGSALPHVYFIFILVFLIIRASILTHYYPHNIPHFSPFLTIYQHYFCVHTK